MVKKKLIKSKDIQSKYTAHVLNHNERPKSVYSFAKSNGFEESDFYKFFGSFDSLEQSIFKAFFDNTLSVLEKNDDYHSFNARNKMLSFYFTFFEVLTANRSYVVHALHDATELKKLSTLAKLKHAFSNYIETLDIETLDLKQDKIEKIKDRTLKESAWIQLVVTLKFWLDDSSAAFEKTDIFIEKAVNASFDLLDVKPIKSVIDLGKFIFKETFKMK